MFTLPNLLSLSRIPLLFIFLYGSLFVRLLSIIIAALTDFFDGYLARRNKQISRIGTILDPITDKLFVGFLLATLYFEEKILLWQALTMLVRDFSVFLFGVWLFLTRQLSIWEFRSIWSGKIMTTLQLVVLILLTIGVSVPSPFYFAFIVIGSSAFFELYKSCHSFLPPEIQHPVEKIKEAQLKKKLSKSSKGIR